MRRYTQIWCVDFEFRQPDGGTPEPHCFVAQDFHSGRREQLWLADGSPAVPPYATDAGTLFVCYMAAAELSCHLVTVP
jgi:hypothetical protein